jgi:hypothetical protein
MRPVSAHLYWGFRVQSLSGRRKSRALYLPVGDSLGVPLLALPVAARFLSGVTVACGGGGRGSFSFRGSGGRGGGAELFRPHLCGVGEDAAGWIESARIHLTGGGGGGGQVRAACARAGQGKEGSNLLSSFGRGLLAYVHGKRGFSSVMCICMQGLEDRWFCTQTFL